MNFLLTLIFAVTCCAAQIPEPPMLISNVQVVDPATRTIKLADVEIEEGVVKSVKPHRPGTELRTTIDGTGLWLIPGLHDMHVHSYGNPGPSGAMDLLGTVRSAEVMLAAGVTAFLDLFSPEHEIFTLRDRQRKFGMQCADIFAAGPILTCPGGHGTEYGIPTRTISDVSEAEREVAALEFRKPDVVKIVYDHAYSQMPTIDKITMEAAVKWATKVGLKTVVHIGTWQDAREAVEAGASCITHVYGKPIPASLVKLLRQKHVYEIPTMSVHTELVNITNQPLLLDSPLLKQTTSGRLIEAYRNPSQFDARTKALRDYLAPEVKRVAANVKTMQKGGVQLLAGTDSGNLGTFQGYSLHRELELMVAAGLSPWEALASATTTAGKFLGTRVGFRVGDVANFVLLKGSPIADIRNTQAIEAVVLHGKKVNREAILE